MDEIESLKASDGNTNTNEESSKNIIKPKRRSLVERELETNLTARVTSPVSYGEAKGNISRYGRTRRLKTDPEFCDSDKALKTTLEPTKSENLSVKSPVHKTPSSSKPNNQEVILGTEATTSNVVQNQIENIAMKNASHSLSIEKNKASTPTKTHRKIYIRKDLIQSKEKQKTGSIIKNIFSPTKSSYKPSTNTHLNNILERSSEKYDLKINDITQSSYLDNSSVVKTLDFDSGKKIIHEESAKNAPVTVSKSDLFEQEAKSEYQVGDLAWSRVGTYPFWPCIITRDPFSGFFVKKKLFGRVEREVYHVTFFGDNGRRGWIVDNMLRRYQGLGEFEATKSGFTPQSKKKDPRFYAAFFISDKKRQSWDVSVQEAEALMREPKRLRIDLLIDMLNKTRVVKTTPKRQKSDRIVRTDSDVSLSESLYDTLFSEDDSKTDDHDKTKARPRKVSLDVSDVVTACLDNMAAKTGIPKIQKQSHMDRWLQKAKSKTPEKAKFVATKTKRETKGPNSGRKTRKTPSKDQKRLIVKSNCCENENDSLGLLKITSGYQLNEHDYSQLDTENADPGSNSDNVIIANGINVNDSCGIGIIFKVETLSDGNMGADKPAVTFDADSNMSVATDDIIITETNEPTNVIDASGLTDLVDNQTNDNLQNAMELDAQKDVSCVDQDKMDVDATESVVNSTESDIVNTEGSQPLQSTMPSNSEPSQSEISPVIRVTRRSKRISLDPNPDKQNGVELDRIKDISIKEQVKAKVKMTKSEEEKTLSEENDKLIISESTQNVTAPVVRATRKSKRLSLEPDPETSITKTTKVDILNGDVIIKQNKEATKKKLDRVSSTKQRRSSKKKTEDDPIKKYMSLENEGALAVNIVSELTNLKGSSTTNSASDEKSIKATIDIVKIVEDFSEVSEDSVQNAVIVNSVKEVLLNGDVSPEDADKQAADDVCTNEVPTEIVNSAREITVDDHNYDESVFVSEVHETFDKTVQKADDNEIKDIEALNQNIESVNIINNSTELICNPSVEALEPVLFDGDMHEVDIELPTDNTINTENSVANMFEKEQQISNEVLQIESSPCNEISEAFEKVEDEPKSALEVIIPGSAESNKEHNVKTAEENISMDKDIVSDHVITNGSIDTPNFNKISETTVEDKIDASGFTVNNILDVNEIGKDSIDITKFNQIPAKTVEEKIDASDIIVNKILNDSEIAEGPPVIPKLNHILAKTVEDKMYVSEITSNKILNVNELTEGSLDDDDDSSEPESPTYEDISLDHLPITDNVAIEPISYIKITDQTAPNNTQDLPRSLSYNYNDELITLKDLAVKVIRMEMEPTPNNLEDFMEPTPSKSLEVVEDVAAPVIENKQINNTKDVDVKSEYSSVDDEDNLSLAVISRSNSEESKPGQSFSKACAKPKRKNTTQDKMDIHQALENPEFLKYIEIQQDALMDENPNITEDELLEYLFKTWLYSENLKSETVKTHDKEQSTLVKGTSDEPLPQPKKIRKKTKVDKEMEPSSTEDVAPKDRSKRKVARAYYNENDTDFEDDLQSFDIPKETNTDKNQAQLGTVSEQPETEEYVDEVELFFSELAKPKPNVFKGIVRERVCEICERPGNLIKCNGLCGGRFHIDCIKKQIEPLHPPNAPTRGRKKKRGRPGRKPKSLDDSGSLSDDKTDQNHEDISADENLVIDAENFETQLEEKMQEMLKSELPADYDYSSEDELQWNDTAVGKCEIVDVKLKLKRPENEYSDFKCSACQKYAVPLCFVCKSTTSPKNSVELRQKCQTAHCHKFYHLECLEFWPQTQFSGGERSRSHKKMAESFEAMTCPRHVCHTCVCDDPRGCNTRFSGDKLARCIRCPATYHSFNKCLPAGSTILSASQIICPRHYEHRPGKVPCHVNTGWCFICALGGTLICCEYCPTSFHAECLNIKPPEGNYMCEDCETGRLPLYGEMVWVKLGHYRWWPGIVLHPSEIPENIMAVKHSQGEFVVRFFGQYDHYWVNRGRVFPFQEGDSGRISSQKSKIDEAFTMAMEHAQRACEVLKNAAPNEEEDTDIASSLLPPHYVKLKVNKPCGALPAHRPVDDEHSLTLCDCDPHDPQPCGPHAPCLNRMLLTECGPTCRAGDRCHNRAFENRLYPKLTPYRTSWGGWGLKTLEPIKQGQFVIEYVGELLDEAEFRRRMQRKHETRDENYYFLTLDRDRMIDAGPKGNLARFMNHCCEPNCETQKWTVLGDVRVGLFALRDIPANSEVTFNYNLESAGIEKKPCLCGAKRCSGYIGAKPKQEEAQPKKNKLQTKRAYKKRKQPNVHSSPSTNKKVVKPRTTQRSRPKELTEIEKDLLIIKNATNGLSSDSECSGRLSSVENGGFHVNEESNPSKGGPNTKDEVVNPLKRKRVSFSTEEVVLHNGEVNGECSPVVKKVKMDSGTLCEVGD